MNETAMLLISDTERWLPVPGLESRYEVSDRGRVRTLSTYRKALTGSVLSPWKTSRGYLSVSLRDESGQRLSMSLHRVVMLAFVGECPAGMQVAHNNGIRDDNRLSNLRYATPSSNIDDRQRHGRTARGSRNGSAKLDDAAALTIWNLRSAGFSAAEVAHLACVHVSTVQSIWDRETWTHITRESA